MTFAKTEINGLYISAPLTLARYYSDTLDSLLETNEYHDRLQIYQFPILNDFKSDGVHRDGSLMAHKILPTILIWRLLIYI
jgi:hypothetical protein